MGRHPHGASTYTDSTAARRGAEAPHDAIGPWIENAQQHEPSTDPHTTRTRRYVTTRTWHTRIDRGNNLIRGWIDL